MTEEQQQNFFSENSAAKYLGIARGTLRRYRSLGLVDFIPADFVVLYQRAALDAWRASYFETVRANRSPVGRKRADDATNKKRRTR